MPKNSIKRVPLSNLPVVAVPTVKKEPKVSVGSSYNGKLYADDDMWNDEDYWTDKTNYGHYVAMEMYNQRKKGRTC